MDDVYSHQSVQYVNGKFYGAEDGQITKTLLCVMLKAIAGKFRDVAMVLNVNINADILHSVWKNVVSQISDIAFDISVIMTDGHSSNMPLFNKKSLKNSEDLFAQNEEKLDSKILLLFDPTHLFKNVYNNWLKKINFQCPTFIIDDKKKDMLPSLSHINELYEPEKGKHEKMAYNISEQVLHPQVNEESSVKMAYNISEQVLHPQVNEESSVKMAYNISEQVLHPQVNEESSVKMAYNISEQVLHPQVNEESSVKMAYNISEQVLHPQVNEESSVKMAYNISEQVLHPQVNEESSVKMAYNISEQVLHPQVNEESSVKMAYNISEQVLHPQVNEESSVKMAYNISEQVLHPQVNEESSVKMAYNISEQYYIPK